MDATENLNDGQDPYRRLAFEDEDNISRHDCIDSIEVIHSRIAEELIPKVDMQFKSLNEAHEFYLAYAKAVGFGVRIWRSHKDKVTGVMLDQTYCCAREGERKGDFHGARKFHRAQTRCNCGAEMKVSCRQKSYYYVVRFVAQHNHVCATPSKTHIFRSHRKMTDAQKAGVDIAISSGIAQKETMELMSRQAGGREHLGFISSDCKNYLHSKRSHKMRVGDTGGVLQYLQQKQGENPNFFYAIQVDQDDLITNIFWADAKMRSDYSHFGDVVCFDTTYRKHKDGRPIALFVGVNSHKQTIVFGAALLYDETAVTFSWLFDTFAKSMKGKMPETILTNQDKAMSKALASQWKETYHRLCVWHINKNAAVHLGHIFASHKCFVKDFSSCMHDHENEDEFIEAWNDMLDKYDLRNNEWLRELFKIKEKWALVYGRETFCADMTTTQRSESMNSVIKKYISYKNELVEFFEHFERLLKDRRYKELVEDHKNSQSEPSSTLRVQILNHAASVYTHKIFELFHVEVCKAYDCNIESCGEQGPKTEYNVKYFQSRRHHHVTYDSNGGLISCSCKKFEFVGIFCSHALRILNLKQISTISEKYIKKRWMKTAKEESGNVHFSDTSQLDPKEAPAYRYSDLCQLSFQLTTRATESTRAYEIAKKGLQKLLEQVNASFVEDVGVEPKGANTSISDSVGTTVQDSISCKKVRGLKAKEKVTYGSRSKRPKSCLEKATRKRKSVITVKGKESSSPVVPIVNVEDPRLVGRIRFSHGMNFQMIDLNVESEPFSVAQSPPYQPGEQINGVDNISLR
ncbi:hypothetical protein OROGR_005640 [Orobanche gracilis]